MIISSTVLKQEEIYDVYRSIVGNRKIEVEKVIFFKKGKNEAKMSEV